jgi:hypothetical protein
MTARGTVGRVVRFALAPVALVALAPLGCGGGPEYAEVGGTVTLDGKPLPDVEVVFMPNPGQGPSAGAASCYTDAAGRYRLRTQRADRAGAVVGKHVVVMIDVAAYPPPVLDSGSKLNLPPGASYRQGKQRVPPTYSHPAETPFRDIEVRPGSQSLDFDLKRNPKR